MDGASCMRDLGKVRGLCRGGECLAVATPTPPYL
jgi:hypothetical protein